MEPLALKRQHLIDPEICIRCNTCEDTCTRKAITHDRRSYAVRFDLCDDCGDCLPPCPTGAIDSWRRVLTPHGVEAQLAWDSLPRDQEPPADVPGEAGAPGAPAAALPEEVAAITAAASSSQGGAARPPWSAAHPYVNLYTPARPALATVTGSYRLTAEDATSDIRHLVLDFGRTGFPVLEGQSIGIVPPGRDEEGRPHRVRLYSVASPRNGERPGYNNLALTVKRVTEDPDGRPVRGLASNYLCDLKKGDKVEVVGPYGATFLMPNHPGSSLLMICTGTGAAPMRAMTERRRRRVGRGADGQPPGKEGGSLTLFFGARTRGELPYFGPLMRLPRDFIDVNLAFSRDPAEPRRYVQDLLLLRGDRIAELLRDEDCYIYVCGHKRMEAGVASALQEICRRAGLDWERLRPELTAASRYHIETY